MPDALLVDTVISVSRQVGKVFIVDNSSIFESKEVLQAIKLSCRDEQNCRVVIIENGENLGVGAAVNMGIKAAKAEGFTFVFLLDQDSIVPDNIVNNLITTYQQLEDIVPIGILAPENKGLCDNCHSLQLQNPKSRNPLSELAMKFKSINDLVVGGTKIVEVSSTILSGMLVRTSLFDVIGYFREDFFVGSEDTEFCFRLRKKGFKVMMTSSGFIRHRLGDELTNGDQAKTTLQSWVFPHLPWRHYYIVRNSLDTARSHFSFFPKEALYLVVSLPIFLLSEVVAYGSFKEKFAYSVRGLIDFLNHRMGKLIYD